MSDYFINSFLVVGSVIVIILCGWSGDYAEKMVTKYPMKMSSPEDILGK